VRDLYHPRLEDVGLPNILHALSDPVRLEIVRVLASTDEIPCSSLNAAVSKRMMSLRQTELEERFPGLLNSILDAAKAA
jgi:DNA-binding transcriptional ArsR family regulator